MSDRIPDPIGMRLPLYGDDIGYVELVDYMGDEFTPAEDARTSTDKGRLGPEKDAALQRRLLRDRHTSPFEGVVVKFEVCVPLFVLREMDRHRTTEKLSDADLAEIVSPEEDMRKWFSRNEMSGRYVMLPDSYYFPKVVRGQSATNKQGGSEGAVEVPMEVQEEFITRGAELTRQARELYRWAVEAGIEKGLARIHNTMNQYTRIRISGSLKNWLDACRLRLPKDVLWECRVVFEQVEYVLQQLFPSVMEQWVDTVRDAVTLTATEVAALRKCSIEDAAFGDDSSVLSARRKLGM